MNSVQLVGRFTRDPDIRYTDSGTSIARFTLAVDRAYKREEGQNADFISCVAFGTGKSLDSLDHMQDGTMNLSRRKQMNY